MFALVVMVTRFKKNWFLQTAERARSAHSTDIVWRHGQFSSSQLKNLDCVAVLCLPYAVLPLWRAASA